MKWASKVFILVVVFACGLFVGGKITNHRIKYGIDTTSGCGGNAGRGTIFNGINHIEFYMPGYIGIDPYLPRDDLKNILRDIVRKNFAKCFDAEAADAINFSNMSCGQTMNDSHTLVIVIARRSIELNYSNSYDNSVLIPAVLTSLGPRSSVLSVEFYRKGFSSGSQADALAYFTQTAIIPDSEDKNLKSFIQQFLERSIKPQATFGGEDNLHLYQPGFFEQIKNYMLFGWQVLTSE